MDVNLGCPRRVSLEEALAILLRAAAVVVQAEDGGVAIPAMWDRTGDDANEFMLLRWDSEGVEMCTRFAEGENRQVTVSGNSMFLADQDGDEMQITPLFEKELDCGTATLEMGAEIIKQASAVIVDSDDGGVVFPSLYDLNGEDDNEFCYMGWESGGVDYYLKFAEGENREISLAGCSMFMTDHEGDEVQITPLFEKELVV